MVNPAIERGSTQPNKAIVPIISNWQEQTSPTHCLWFCPHTELVQRSPIIAFPTVSECLLLIGKQNDTNFFGHVSPLTAGIMGTSIDHILKVIDSESQLPQTHTPQDANSVTIYTVAENDSPTAKTPMPIAVRDFKHHFEQASFNVKLHTLPHSFFGKTLLWSPDVGIFQSADTTQYTIEQPIPLGRYSRENIYTEDG